MLNRLFPLVIRLRDIHPPSYDLLVKLGKRFLGNRLGVYPRLLGNEIGAVTEVLRSSAWNMAYGRGLVHERLEREFADYVGVQHAVAVGSGGMALQMSMRVLGLEPGDEIVHQVDTCSATAMAAMNAGVTPIFADVSPATLMLDEPSVEAWAGPATRGLIVTHSWGNPEDAARFRALADRKGWRLIEDACQALGATTGDRPAGAWGDTGVFSFGCLKPVQAGEGGMIVTADESLARELRSIRHWGDRTLDFGERDVTQLSWNGRMSEIVAAVALEQLRGYPAQLEKLRANVLDFAEFLGQVPELVPLFGAGRSPADSACTQLVLRIDTEACMLSKKQLWDALAARGVPLWHANFELIPTLGFFSRQTWRKWARHPDLDRLAGNYNGDFPNAQAIFEHTGIGLGRMNFLSTQNLAHLKRSVKDALSRRQ